MSPVLVKLEKEVADLRERVERLEQVAAEPAADERVRQPWEAHLPPYLQLVDGRTLKPLFVQALREAGFDPKPPAISPEELQAAMVAEGLDPDARVGNTILAEMRGESG